MDASWITRPKDNMHVLQWKTTSNYACTLTALWKGFQTQTSWTLLLKAWAILNLMISKWLSIGALIGGLTFVKIKDVR